MMIADETPFGNLIVLKKSGEEGGMCEMKNNVLLIGRDPEKCDIQIRLPEVSKMQARLTADEYRQVWIENLSQTNPLGTLLNDERCDGQPHLLANKDIITICGRRFRFEYCNAEVDMMRTVMIPAFAKAPAAAAANPKSAIAAAAPLEVARGAALKADTPKAGPAKENASNDGAPSSGRRKSAAQSGRTPLGAPDHLRSALEARRSKLTGDFPTPDDSPAAAPRVPKSPFVPLAPPPLAPPPVAAPPPAAPLRRAAPPPAPSNDANGALDANVALDSNVLKNAVQEAFRKRAEKRAAAEESAGAAAAESVQPMAPPEAPKSAPKSAKRPGSAKKPTPAPSSCPPPSNGSGRATRRAEN